MNILDYARSGQDWMAKTTPPTRFASAGFGKTNSYWPLHPETRLIFGRPSIKYDILFNTSSEQFGLKILNNRNRLTMAELKTKQNNADVSEFINSFADSEQKRIDSFELIRLIQDFTGFEPKMWGPSIIGFGSYHYKSERSRQEGDWPLVGFSPRKAAISLYVYTGAKEHEQLLNGLGKYKMGKACIYIKKFADINQDALRKLMKVTIEYLQSRYK